MDVLLKFLLFLSLALIAASQQLETDYVQDPCEDTREFIRDQNEDMKKLLKEEMQKMFATMLRTFGDQLLKMTGQLGSLKKTLHADHKQLSESVSYLTTSLLLILTEVEEINAERGTIEFTGGNNPHLRTKIWILQSKGGTSFREMSFVLQENGLREDTRLSLWGSATADGKQQMWTGSQGDWQTKKENAGHVILVTLVISPGEAETPRFKLKFNSTSSGGVWLRSSQIFGGERRQVISFPLNNTQKYPPFSEFVAVIAPPQGGSFPLTLRFLDLPGTPPGNCVNNIFSVWVLTENSTGFPFSRLPSSVVRRCGRVGTISEPLGNSAVAILQFWNKNNSVGRGFRVETY